MNLSEQAIYWGSTALAIICVIVSVYKIYMLIKNDVKSKVLRLLIPILIIINPFSIELFLFIEKGIMMFGILMSIFAVEKMIKYFETKNNRNILYGMFFMFLANCSYQGVTGILVVISTVFVVKYSKKFKDFVKNNFVLSVIYFVPAVLDYLLIKLIYTTSRTSGEIIIIESLKKVATGTFNMIVSTYNLLPKWAFVMASVFMIIYVLIKNRRDLRLFLIGIFRLLYIIFATIFVAIIPQIVQPTDAIWFVARSTYPFASLFGILVLYLNINYNRSAICDIKYANSNIENVDGKVRKMKNIEIYAIILACFILIGMETQTFCKIVKDRYVLNQLDYEVSMQIVNKIYDYESETGVVINKIAIYSDSSPRYTYDGIFATGDINVKAFSADWCTEAVLEYYLDRDLEVITNNQLLEDYFSEQNWDYFDFSQVLFDDDVLILCRY